MASTMKNIVPARLRAGFSDMATKYGSVIASLMAGIAGGKLDTQLGQTQFALCGIAMLGFATVDQLRDWSKGKSEEELKKQLLDRIQSQAEEQARFGEQQLVRLHNIKIRLLTILQKLEEQARNSKDSFETLLTQFLQMSAVTEDSFWGELYREVEWARDDIAAFCEQMAAMEAHVTQKIEESQQKTVYEVGVLISQQEAQRIQVQHEFAERFLHQLMANMEINTTEARQRALKELPALVHLPMREIQEIVDRKLPVSTPTSLVSPLERARSALAQGNFNEVFEASDEERQNCRELAMLEGTAALAKFRETPSPEWNARALTAFQRALALSDRTREPESWGEAAFACASLLADLSHYAQAEPLLIEVRQIWIKEHGEDSAKDAIVINDLAQLLKATNRLTEAEPLMRRALEIDEHSYEPDHPDVAIGLNNLAKLLQATNRLAEAEPLMRRAVQIMVASFGSDHPSSRTVTKNYELLLAEM